MRLCGKIWQSGPDRRRQCNAAHAPGMLGVTRATDKHWKYVILIAFPLQQWLRERASMFRLYLTLSVCTILVHGKTLLSSSDQPIMQLLHMSRHITVPCAFRRTSAPFSGRLIFSCWVFGASTRCKHLSKRADTMRSSHWCSVFQDFTKATCTEKQIAATVTQHFSLMWRFRSV